MYSSFTALLTSPIVALSQSCCERVYLCCHGKVKSAEYAASVMLSFCSYKSIFCLFMNTISTQTVKRQMVGSLMNNKLERIRKEVVVA